MIPFVRRWTGTVAAAVVLAYAGTIAITEVGDFALWRIDFLRMSALAVVCGALLALISKHALGSMFFAATLASLGVAALWSYIQWSFLMVLLGGQLSYAEFFLSNPFWFYIVPRSALVLLATLPPGAMAVVLTAMLTGTD